MSCSHRAVMATLLVPVLASGLAAQETSQPTNVVEILGLHSWTPEMVEEAVASHSPGMTLRDAACAIILRDRVGFADAASITISFGGDTTWTILPVVEPEMRHLVRFRTYGTRRPDNPEWNEIFAVLQADPRAMSPLQHPEVLLGNGDEIFGSPLSGGTMELRRVLRTRDSQSDWELARTTILSDSSFLNRTVAALVLSNFRERDETFHLLLEGVRATDSGAGTAAMTLSALARGTQRPVDWAPARDALEAVMGGTNLFAYRPLLESLVATGIEPALGRELARINPRLLLDHLGAQNPMTPVAAHRFLQHVSGADFGRDVDAWQEWLASERG